YDTLERTADIDIGERHPFGEDALQKWERLRARSRAPDAAPVGRAKVEHDRRWQKWFRESFIEMMGSSTFAAIMGRIVSDQRAYAREQVEPLRRSLDRARRDLAAANAEIKRLKRAPCRDRHVATRCQVLSHHAVRRGGQAGRRHRSAAGVPAVHQRGPRPMT